MDKLKAPLRIPPEFSTYAEEKHIFELYERMLQALLIERPADPLSFLVAYLERGEDDVPKVVVYGPPASGQHSISKLISRKLRVVHVQPEKVVDEGTSSEAEHARACDQEITPRLWADLLHQRLGQADCVTKGWVLEGFPQTRIQGLELQAKGIIAKHFIHLEAPDLVLMERYAGKRLDSLTGDIYHTVFNPPPNAEVAGRLISEPGGMETFKQKLEIYHRHSKEISNLYTKIAKKFNADQPLDDLFSQVHSFLCTKWLSAAPYTPRVVLLGPTGSGKNLQAAQLARKYHIIDVDCRQIIKQTLISGSKLAEQMKPFYEKKMLIPDDMVMQCLSRRLSQWDCATRGWVLHGYPLNRDQSELLAQVGHKPNRVIFLNVPEDTVKERLTLRRMDPVTGQRYHLLLKPPPTQEVSSRLVPHPKDTEDNVGMAYATYQSYLDELAEYYSWGSHVNGDQDPLTVAECIETIVINPLPKQNQ